MEEFERSIKFGDLKSGDLKSGDLKSGDLVTAGPAATAKNWIGRGLIGATAWALWAVAAAPPWTAVLLLLSPFVLVPLGLRVAGGPETGPDAPVLQRLAITALAPAALAAASYLPSPGFAAMTLTLPWLAVTASVAFVGLARLLSRPRLNDPGLATDAGMMFLVVGGAWLTISRGGFNPLGFSDAIVELTAVHFHYAGFALPIVAGVVATGLRRSAAIPVAVVIGVPATAIGITLGGWTEWFAATAMALAGLATAWLLLQSAVPGVGKAGRWLFALSGLSLMAGMGLALGWAWAVRFGWSFIGLEQMAATHGTLNALGFGLLALTGLNVVAKPCPSIDPEVGLHLGRPATATLQRLADKAQSQATTNRPGLLNRHRPTGLDAERGVQFSHRVWRREIEHGNFSDACDAVRNWQGHAGAGIKLHTARPELRVGETLALAIPVGPISVSATCRIVDVVDEPDRFGFTYSTLPHHPEDGEEAFIITKLDDGTVDVVVTAVWRPATLANHLWPPLTRFLQNRAINQYLEGIATATTAAGASDRGPRCGPATHR
jgi:uncharacterized protein (UPF0548 family)